MRYLRGMRTIAILLLVTSLSATGQQWEQMPDFPGIARDDAASFNWHDKIFVGTGRDVGFQYTNDWYVFDTGTETWAPIASLPASGRQYCSGFVLSDGIGFLFGGVGANGPLSELWRYQFLTDSWEQMAPLPAPGRYACSVIPASGQYAYVCGGLLQGGIPTNEVWRYDQVTNSWTEMAPFPGTPRHRATTMGDLLIGGADVDHQALSDVYQYNPGNDTWTQRPDIPAPRFGAKTAGFFLFCGASSLADFHDNTFQRAWPPNYTWSEAAVQPFPGGPRRGAVAAMQEAVSHTCRAYFGTGLNGSTRYNDWWRLNCPFSSIDEIPDRTIAAFPNPASGHVAVTLPHGWTNADFRIHDAIGRTVSTGLMRNSAPISIATLAPGRYELLLTHADRTFRAPFIKLP